MNSVYATIVISSIRQGRLDALNDLLDRIALAACDPQVDPKSLIGLKLAVDMISEEIRGLQP